MHGMPKQGGNHRHSAKRKGAKGVAMDTNKKKIEELYVKAQIAIMSDQYEQADGFLAGIVALAPRYVACDLSVVLALTRHTSRTPHEID
jgi:hypothetical protein